MMLQRTAGALGVATAGAVLNGTGSERGRERAMKSLWIGGRSSVEVPCTIEIERSRDTLHAHVSLEGIEVEHGDEVLVHGLPTTHPHFGERVEATGRATVWRAGPLSRALTRIKSYLLLTELYEVGFQPKHEIVIKPVKRVEE